MPTPFDREPTVAGPRCPKPCADVACCCTRRAGMRDTIRDTKRDAGAPSDRGMSRISDPATLEGLLQRLETLQPDAQAKWGTLTAPEVLCQLGDATHSVLAPKDTAEVARRREAEGA